MHSLSGAFLSHSSHPQCCSLSKSTSVLGSSRCVLHSAYSPTIVFKFCYLTAYSWHLTPLFYCLFPLVYDCSMFHLCGMLSPFLHRNRTLHSPLLSSITIFCSLKLQLFAYSLTSCFLLLPSCVMDFCSYGRAHSDGCDVSNSNSSYYYYEIDIRTNMKKNKDHPQHLFFSLLPLSITFSSSIPKFIRLLLLLSKETLGLLFFFLLLNMFFPSCSNILLTPSPVFAETSQNKIYSLSIYYLAQSLFTFLMMFKSILFPTTANIAFLFEYFLSSLIHFLTFQNDSDDVISQTIKAASASRQYTGTNALYFYCPAVSHIDSFTFSLFMLISFSRQHASTVDSEFGSNSF